MTDSKDFNISNPIANEEQTLDIEEFDPHGLAKKLSEEALRVVPAQLQEQDKKSVVDFVYKFSAICVKSLVENNDKNNFTTNQIEFFTQLVGEWIFHKSIDLIIGGMPVDLREGVLNKVAFMVYETAKQMISNKLPQDQIVQFVEVQVNKAFKTGLDDLKEKGEITEELANKVMNQSNIDVMTQQYQMETQKIQEENEALGSDSSDSKILKLVALAVLIKKLPEDKTKAIYEKLSKSEASALIQYAKMPNLESKVDKRIFIANLTEIKNEVLKFYHVIWNIGRIVLIFIIFFAIFYFDSKIEYGGYAYDKIQKMYTALFALSCILGFKFLETIYKNVKIYLIKGRMYKSDFAYNESEFENLIHDIISNILFYAKFIKTEKIAKKIKNWVDRE